MKILEQPLAEFRKYTSSFYFFEGIRLTVTIALPVIIGMQLNHLAYGLAMGFGALALGIADSAGPQHHRFNGMVLALAGITLVMLITIAAFPFKLLFIGWLALLGFLAGMITVFGNRANNLATACLIILVLTINQATHSNHLGPYIFFTVAGGTVYFVFSMVLNQLQPYKLPRRMLGNSLFQLADFLRTKQELFKKGAPLEELTDKLLEVQVLVNTSQQELREILFKTRAFLKESNMTSRSLLMAFLESVDFFERALMSHVRYEDLYKNEGNEPVAQQIQIIASLMADVLDELALAFQQGNGYELAPNLDKALLELRQMVSNSDAQDATGMQSDVGLNLAANNLYQMYLQIQRMAFYSNYPKKINNEAKLRLQQFVKPTQISVAELQQNLNFSSNVFRYALRLSLSLVAGYLMGMALPVGHFYWILLTVVVILKPAYSLTRTRNQQRLLGTLMGALLGGSLVWLVHSKTALLFITLACMVVAFSEIRHRYLISVIFLTAYLIIAFYLLRVGQPADIIKDRLLDTLIGGTIAFTSGLLIPPIWEMDTLPKLVAIHIRNSRNYLEYFAKNLNDPGASNINTYKLLRKQLFVSLANMNGGFGRMMNEPENHRKNNMVLHHLVVSCQMLVGYLTSINTIKSSFQKLPVDPLTEQIKKLILDLEIAEQNISHWDQYADKTTTETRKNITPGVINMNPKFEQYPPEITSQISLLSSTVQEIKKISTAITINE